MVEHAKVGFCSIQVVTGLTQRKKIPALKLRLSFRPSKRAKRLSFKNIHTLIFSISSYPRIGHSLASRS